MGFFFYSQQTVATQTVGIVVGEIFLFVVGEGNAVALTLQNIADLTFERFVTASAGFCFVLAHVEILTIDFEDKDKNQNDHPSRTIGGGTTGATTMGYFSMATLLLSNPKFTTSFTLIYFRLK